MIKKNKIWFITGCSSGFGRELAKQLLNNDYRVVVTARDTNKLQDLVALNESNALMLSLDVTNETQVKQAVSEAETHFGAIDVLVNNAGFGYFGAIEESGQQEVRCMFETNFWGLSHMTRAVLPKMRRRREGFIVNISSIGGFVGNPGLGYYNATKFAVNGFSEALRAEVAPLGIKVLLIQPSGFRTDWAGRSAKEAQHLIPDYTNTAGKIIDAIREGSGYQPGDPVRAVEAIIKAVESEKPPFNLLLGRGAFKGARTKLDNLEQEFGFWAKVTEGADFPLDVKSE